MDAFWIGTSASPLAIVLKYSEIGDKRQTDKNCKTVIGPSSDAHSPYGFLFVGSNADLNEFLLCK